MKKAGKSLVVTFLSWQVRRLLKRNNTKVVAVAGSIGKTSTKFAIAGMLRTYYKVQMQDGNYNDAVTVPLVFFGEANPPNLTNPIAWLRIFWRNESMLSKKYPYDVVLVELGSDGPGQLEHFSKLLRPDIGVLTAITPEHMEFFKTLEAVAREELQIAKFCEQMVVCVDDVEPQHLAKITNPITYGLSTDADFRLSGEGHEITITHDDKAIKATSNLIGLHVQKSLAAAAAVAISLGQSFGEDMAAAVGSITAVPGRMQLLDGKNDSTVIDDTYNNVAPEPVLAALDVLYEWPARNRIAVLGNMNELGEHSQEAHIRVGKYCDPEQLQLVMTIGPEANTFLAEEARKAGCKVETFDSPYQLGKSLLNHLNKDTVVLVKGSQNRVFLEEAVKQILRNENDVDKLVRQSDKWLKHKTEHFK